MKIAVYCGESVFMQKKGVWCLTVVGACDKPLLHDPYGQMARCLATARMGLPADRYVPQVATAIPEFDNSRYGTSSKTPKR